MIQLYNSMQSVFRWTLGLGLCAVAVLATAREVTDADIDYSFYPYKQEGFPQIGGAEIGKTINQSNVDLVKDFLDPGTYKFIKDGWWEMRVGAPFEYELHQGYMQASKANKGVGIESGNLTNYVSGRPFPYKPDKSDPLAGEKLLWNFEYGRIWGDLGCLQPWYWEYKDIKTAKIERTLKYDRMCLARFGYRTVDEPKPDWGANPDGIYRGIYLRVESPFDLKNTQLLIHKYKNDTKQLDGWIYLGFQRRVRRFATGQMTDAFLGSDIMVEDFEGYEGQISQYTWEYKGEKTILAPFWKHNDAVAGYQSKFPGPEGYKYIGYTGKGECFPNAPWSARKVYVVEGKPKDPNHPISKREMYIDAQVNEIPISLIYDRKGEWWKWFHIGHVDNKDHLPINKETGGVVHDSASLIDVQAQHCTTIYFHGVVDPKLTDEKLFNVQNLRSSGR
ncbi:MAG: DUF1329 domain-containing protein [Gammaproteobacteria bacterium]|nr:DUF1329 domain-containing protein [Gammaproteobacteria bacterium]